MILEQMLKDERREGRREGRSEGLKEGRSEGERVGREKNVRRVFYPYWKLGLAQCLKNCGKKSAAQEN